MLDSTPLSWFPVGHRLSGCENLQLLQLLSACVITAAAGLAVSDCGNKLARSFDTAAGIECSSKMLAVASCTTFAFIVTTSCSHSQNVQLATNAVWLVA